ncbi:MAG: riboflavin biosynthesis protein RibD [Gammaproteobacteria bacterium SG8_31]|jgi:diaminohydroxyphosphoribosylaminopyrimidine deaminase/5-amino-6-(5-phosphoribosylamino)uracil reductase|nr:MAG: riboflavin biosynthesis protein RibD [Gammaproteobacteria bacterium SG8_31]
MNTIDDRRFMARAIQLARKGLYTTDPNPRVGCVVVGKGEIVGEGWHERAGGPHAEINALRMAGESARGATAYITLEPCCHQGRTPPCSHALIQAGVVRVVAAMTDPNPQVAGEGLKQLAAAGIATQAGLLEGEAEALNPGFLMRMRSQRPYVRCKLAMSVDGRTAMASGESRWITGDAARHDVHRLRARSSAIMTAIGTVLADDPALTARLENDDQPVTRQPLRVILDRQLRMPPEAKMLRLPGNTLVFTANGDVVRRRALETAGAEIETVARSELGVDLGAVLARLADREMNEIMVEAGPRLAGSLLAAGFIDELVVYMAPHLMGNMARGLFELPWLARMNDRVSLDIHDIRAVGRDWRITATVTSGAR